MDYVVAATRGCPVQEVFAHSVSHSSLAVGITLTGTRSAGSVDFAHLRTTGKLPQQKLLFALKGRPPPAALDLSCVSADK